MLFGVYFLLLAGTGIAAPNPVELMTSTEISAIHLGHAVASTGPPLGPGAQPTKMRHLCKSTQQAVQNTATRLLTIIRISVPSLSGITLISEGHFGRVCATYHKIIPAPVIDSALALEGGDPQSGLQPDGTVMHHHEVHIFHRGSQPGGPFLHRVHHALVSLGPWEGRIVAFVLGVLLCIVWVLAVLLVRGTHGTPEREETVLVCAEEVVPVYTEIEEKQISLTTSKD